MTCPTCGKPFRKGQGVCSFCGALLTSAYLAEGKAAQPVRLPTAPSPHAGQARPGAFPTARFPDEAAAPEFEGEFAEELGPPPARPKAPPAPPPSPAKLSLGRLLVVLLFFLVPIFNYLLRNTPFGSRPDETAPVVQRLVFSADIRDGRPVNPKSVFSLSSESRVVAYGLWQGNRGRHVYALRWNRPDGKLQPGVSTVTRSGSTEGEFATYGVLPLRPDLPLGTWRVELMMDSRVASRSSFELRE